MDKKKDKKKEEIFAKADEVAKRLGATTKGNGGSKRRSKASSKVKPTKISGSYGLKVEKKF